MLCNILHLVSVRWWNASAYYAVSLADALKRAGVHSIVAGKKGSPPLRKAAECDLPCWEEVNLESLRPDVAIRDLVALKKMLRKADISLINAHRPEDGVFSAVSRLGSAAPLPVVRTVSDVRSPKRVFGNRWFHEQGADHFIFTCKASYERYQRVWPVFESRSTIIYSAIDTEKFYPLKQPAAFRKTFGISPQEVVVGMIARLSPVKGHHTFLKAAKLIAEQAENVKFLISGKASEVSHDDLRDMVQALGLTDKVILLPEDDNITIHDLIHSIDIGVVASSGSEVICRIAVEYMAMGRPQVVTGVNVLPEIVKDGENGWIVPPETPAAMAEKVLRLARNADLRREMGKTARAIAEHQFSYPVLAEKTLAVFQEVIQRHTAKFRYPVIK